MSLNIVECMPETQHAEAFVAFINKHRAHKTNLESFRWQFSFQPTSAVVFGLEEGGEIMGSQAMMPMPIHFKGKALLSGKCENSYIEPELRGTGKFGELFNHADQKSSEAGLIILWAFTPAIKPYAKLGFEVVKNGLLSYSVHLNSSSQDAGSIKMAIKRKIKKVLINLSTSKAKKWVRKSSLAKQNAISSQASPKNAEDAVNLLQKVISSTPEGIYLDVSSQFLKWRVHDNPNINYKSLYYYAEEDLAAHCIYAEHKGACRIHYLMVDQTEHLKGIIGDLFLRFQKAGFDYMTYQGNAQNQLNARIFELLRQLGMRKLDMVGEHFVFRIDSQNQEVKTDPSMWFLNRLWTEGYT